MFIKSFGKYLLKTLLNVWDWLYLLQASSMLKNKGQCSKRLSFPGNIEHLPLKNEIAFISEMKYFHTQYPECSCFSSQARGPAMKLGRLSFIQKGHTISLLSLRQPFSSSGVTVCLLPRARSYVVVVTLEMRPKFSTQFSRYSNISSVLRTMKLTTSNLKSFLLW